MNGKHDTVIRLSDCYYQLGVRVAEEKREFEQTFVILKITLPNLASAVSGCFTPPAPVCRLSLSTPVSAFVRTI